MANPIAENEMQFFFRVFRERFSGIPEFDAYLARPGRGELSAEDLAEQIYTQLFSIAVYQGFNPETTLLHLTARNMAMENDHGVISMGTNKAGQPISIKKNASLVTDLRILMGIFAMRGTDYEKMLNRSKDDFVNVLHHLYTKYTIKMDKQKPGEAKVLKPEDITLPRIAATVPSLLCNIFHNRKGKTLFDLRKLGPGAPPVLGTSFIVSCIPNDAINNYPEAHWVFFAIHVLSDRVIHKKTRKFTPFPDMVTYYCAAMNSSAVKEEHKVEACQRWGIIVAESNVSSPSTSRSRRQPKPSIEFTEDLKSCVEYAMEVLYNDKEIKNEKEIEAIMNDLKNEKMYSAPPQE